MDVTIPCPCPLLGGAVQHPDGDTVTLRERLDFRASHALRNDFILMRSEDYVTFGEALAGLTEGYLYHGVVSWTLTDAKRKPLPPSRANVHDVLLANMEAAEAVAEVADDLYGQVIRPLLERASKSSATTPTNDSTSAPTGSSSKTPKRSSRSSTTTTPTDATATTSPPPAGVSS